jgi:hypothetical protein
MKSRCNRHFSWSLFRLWPNRAGLASCLILAVLLAGIVASNVSGQVGKSLLRTIHGTVVDRNEAALKSCVVYLKNLRTSDITTRITDDSGQFRFSGLDPNADYRIQAQQGGTCSDPRTVSSFDSRTDIDLTLKLNRDRCK